MWVRGAVCLFIIVLIMPVTSDESVGMKDQQEQFVSASEVATAARGVINDMSDICTRNPDACRTGYTFAQILKKKARYGAELVIGIFSTESQNDDNLNRINREVSWTDGIQQERQQNEMDRKKLAYAYR